MTDAIVVYGAVPIDTVGGAAPEPETVTAIQDAINNTYGAVAAAAYKVKADMHQLGAIHEVTDLGVAPVAYTGSGILENDPSACAACYCYWMPNWWRQYVWGCPSHNT